MQSKPPLLWYSTYTAGELIVGAYNPDADLLYASKTFATTLGGPSRLASFGGDVYTVASGQLFKVNPKRNDPILVTELTGAGRCLTAFGGRLWVGTSEYWDGVSVVPVTPSLGITSACVWRDVYLVGIEQSSDYVYGTYDGVWTVAALPGTVNNLYGNAVVEYREAVYVASGGTDIYKVVPGVSTAVAHSCPTGSKVMALSVMGDFLFYAYTLYDGGNSTNLIGIHDPEGSSTQWVDDHKTLTEPSLATGEVRALVTFKNRLYLSTQYETGTHTLSCDATSSWYAVDDAPPAVSGLMVGV